MEPIRTFVIDPPWAKERGGGGKGANAHYELVKLADLPTLIFSSGLLNTTAPHQHLYLWATNSTLPDALWLMGRLNFEYKTKVEWIKKQMGIGQYFRGMDEFMLFGTRGRGMDPSVYTGARDIPGVLVADHPRDASGKRIHSDKPPEFIKLIERRSRGRYAEIFSFHAPYSPDWVTWGHDAKP